VNHCIIKISKNLVHLYLIYHLETKVWTDKGS